jgi:hypothetical protein
MNGVPYILFRFATQLFAGLLGVLFIWLLLPALSRPGIERLPTDQASAATAAKQRNAAAFAASIGIIRGDLWAESAFTYTDLLWDRPVADVELMQELQRAGAMLDRALSDAPHQSSAWLFRAMLGLRYPANNIDVAESLRMSYYTGPSEQQLMPLRLRAVTHLDISDDVEMRQFASRDLRFLVTRKQISAITEAYGSASPAGKRFIEQGVRDIDPAMVKSLQSAATGSWLAN